MYNSYIENGVVIAPNVVAEGDKATLYYKGSLYKSGAQSVYARIGYGSSWEGQNDIRMEKTPEGFKTQIDITQVDKLNVAFKDSANNWDNNLGNNYTFEVQER
jgi:hypothetical protein